MDCQQNSLPSLQIFEVFADAAARSAAASVDLEELGLRSLARASGEAVTEGARWYFVMSIVRNASCVRGGLAACFERMILYSETDSDMQNGLRKNLNVR